MPHKNERIYYTAVTGPSGRYYYELFDRQGRDVEIDPGDHPSRLAARRAAIARIQDLQKGQHDDEVLAGGGDGS